MHLPNNKPCHTLLMHLPDEPFHNTPCHILSNPVSVTRTLSHMLAQCTVLQHTLSHPVTPCLCHQDVVACDGPMHLPTTQTVSHPVKFSYRHQDVVALDVPMHLLTTACYMTRSHTPMNCRQRILSHDKELTHFDACADKTPCHVTRSR